MRGAGRVNLEPLVAALADAPPPNVLVLTGAGVSLASGIPTFRGSDPGAVWSTDVTTLGTRAYFERDPVGSWRWYLARFDGLRGATPNAAHHALVQLEAWLAPRQGDFSFQGDFLLVTQNVDGLHRAAGSRALVEVHGRADRVRCSVRHCVHGAPEGTLPRDQVDLAQFARDPRSETLPRCPACDALLRPHVLWFDETYGEHEDYGYLRVRRACSSFEVALCVGTSFSVGITRLVLNQALSREQRLS
ncbi:MAG: Sir2 family NAD-dependent protein deacetylase [Planctomycetota bacterium]